MNADAAQAMTAARRRLRDELKAMRLGKSSRERAFEAADIYAKAMLAIHQRAEPPEAQKKPGWLAKVLG